MGLNKAIANQVAGLVEDARSRLDYIAKQQQFHRGQIDKLDAELPHLSDALNRSERPVPDGSCPACWIGRGVASEMSPQPSADDNVDEYRCKSCGFELSVEVNR